MALLRGARKSAFHLEVKDIYAVPEESEPLRRFLAGEPDDEYDLDEWTDVIRSLTAQGLAMSRIRVVTVPHTDYQRWLLSVTGPSVAAGEDIRYIDRSTVDPSAVPKDDYWLFDDETVAFNLVDSEGVPVGPAVTTDPGIVGYCRTARERLWPAAIRYSEYIRK
ncbi:DUF6879 family protein [Nocardia sp. NPDC003482]|uniref:DUF6879 family protein n=1 Tax=Nocardia sp. NPDC004068 TaxID=3364303 RepID=UPI0036A8FA8B